MDGLERLAAVATGIGVLVLAIALVAILMRRWISAVADLIWIGVLRPRLTLVATCGPAFVVLVAAYIIVPERAGVPWGLPILAAFGAAPILARPLINYIARRRYRPGGSVKLDPASLKFADVFNLEELRLLENYQAPETAMSSTAPGP